MITMTSASQYNDLSDFLAKHNGKSANKDVITHTRIKNQELNIYQKMFLCYIRIYYYLTNLNN